MRESLGIQIRPFTLNDVEPFFETVRASIDALTYWLPWCHADYGLKDAEKWIRFCESAWVSGSEFPLGIFDASTGSVMGGTGINAIRPEYHSGNLGYWVGSSHTGKGVARSAARMAASIGFTELRMTRLEIAVLTHNHASQHVAAALGARLEAVTRNRLYFKGLPADALVYSLIPGDLVDLPTV
jgi:RimJ/RimL family protein N-acetyltransferase